MRSVILLITLVASLWAIDTGSLSFFLMKEGKPLANQKLVIFKKSDTALIEMPSTFNRHAEFVTDSDGYVNTVLPVGTYQLQVLAKEDGKAQAFIKKPFVIEENKESQIIVSLQEDDTVAFEDDETPTVVDHKEDDNLSMRENGSVLISLVSSEDQAPVKDARVFVQGQSLDITSDAKGGVSLELPEGEHTLSIIHSDFSAQTVKVTVIANETVNKSYELSPSSMELEEFVVLAPQVEGSVAAVMAEERNSESIANIVGAEQMARQGDSNAAAALKRVAGITLIGGKDIYVRGLGDRYSATELNGMALPSPNPIKRTIPLDMFPSSIIGSLEVQKTASPDITSSFGGGYVNIRTKKSSDDDYVKLKIGAKMHDSYGDTAITHEGGLDDWTGYDHSFRPFPDSFVTASQPVIGQDRPVLNLTDQEANAMLQSRDVNRQSESVPIGTEFGMEVGTSYVFSSDHELNVLATYEYKSEAELREYQSYEYLYSRYGENQGVFNEATTDLYRTNIQHGGIINASYNLRNFDLGYTLLYVLNTLDQTRSMEGTFGENNSDMIQTYFEWQERELIVNQVNGGLDYDLLVDNRFNFGGEYALASEYVPNDVSYDYRKLNGLSGYRFAQGQSILAYDNRETDDNLVSFYANNRSVIPMMSDEDYVEVGGVTEKKEREYRRVKLEVRNDTIPNSDPITATGNINDIINDGDGSRLVYDLASQPKDSYDAESKRSALYFKSMLKPIDNLDITFGIRKVDYEQSVDQFKVDGTAVSSDEYKLDFTKTLPSIATKYAFDQDNQIRIAYSETYVAPDIREFASSEFVHPEFSALVAGNPDLIETDVKNYDLRYEYYFTPTDTVSIAFFYKDMQNPIEDTREFTTGNLPRFSFANAQSAELMGVELSWYKHLDFVADWLSDFIISGNYTHIESEVQLSEEQKTKLVTQDRGLQGLSPNVINLAMTYEDTGNRVVTLSYNKMDERLMRVALKASGDVILGLDDYEIPPDLVDFTWIENFRSKNFDTNFALTFKAKNLLDDETQWQQGGHTTLVYKTGRSYSLSLSAKF